MHPPLIMTHPKTTQSSYTVPKAGLHGGMVPPAGMLPDDETSAKAIVTLSGRWSVVEWPFNHDPSVSGRS